MPGKMRGSVSKHHRAGLLFPVTRIHRFMKRRCLRRVGIQSVIFLTATLEYLAAEIMELAGDTAHAHKRLRITPRHLQLAVKNDEELEALFHYVTIPGGGVLPNIEPSLLSIKQLQKLVASYAAVHAKTESKASK